MFKFMSTNVVIRDFCMKCDKSINLDDGLWMRDDSTFEHAPFPKNIVARLERQMEREAMARAGCVPDSNIGIYHPV